MRDGGGGPRRGGSGRSRGGRPPGGSGGGGFGGGGGWCAAIASGFVIVAIDFSITDPPPRNTKTVRAAKLVSCWRSKETMTL